MHVDSATLRPLLSYESTVFDWSKKQWEVERRRRGNQGAEGTEGEERGEGM